MATTQSPPFKGIDEAWDKVSPADLVANGMTFVVGYVSEDTTGKNLTRAQIDGYHAAGLGVVLNYEYRADAGILGAARGRRDAEIAAAQAQNLGAPDGTCIYFSIDVAVPAGSLEAVRQYMINARLVCAGWGFTTGVYADYAVAKSLCDNKSVDYVWQTYAWSGGEWETRAVLRQTYNGFHVGRSTVDLDYAYTAEFGQWRPDGSAATGGKLVSATDNRIQAMAEGTQVGPGGEPNVFFGWEVARSDWQKTVDQKFTDQADALASFAALLGEIRSSLGTLVAALPVGGTSPTPTPPEAALLAVGGRIADALEAIASDLEMPAPGAAATAEALSSSVTAQAPPVDSQS